MTGIHPDEMPQSYLKVKLTASSLKHTVPQLLVSV